MLDVIFTLIFEQIATWNYPKQIGCQIKSTQRIENLHPWSKISVLLLLSQYRQIPPFNNAGQQQSRPSVSTLRTGWQTQWNENMKYVNQSQHSTAWTYHATSPMPQISLLHNNLPPIRQSTLNLSFLDASYNQPVNRKMKTTKICDHDRH